MRKLAIVESLGRTVNRVGFKLKKHSPEILVVTGIVGAVASAVMACKATTIVGRKTVGQQVEIVNAFQGEEALKLYSQLTVKNRGVAS